MEFLIVTLPVSLLLAGSLLALVIHAVRSGGFDDWDGPAERLLYDDDRDPEIDAAHLELPPDEPDPGT